MDLLFLLLLSLTIGVPAAYLIAALIQLARERAQRAGTYFGIAGGVYGTLGSLILAWFVHGLSGDVRGPDDPSPFILVLLVAGPAPAAGLLGSVLSLSRPKLGAAVIVLAGFAQLILLIGVFRLMVGRMFLLGLPSPLFLLAGGGLVWLGASRGRISALLPALWSKTIGRLTFR